MPFRKNQIYLIIFILAFFRLSSAVAEETLPQNTVKKLLSSITNLKTEKKLSPNEIKENDITAGRALALLDMQEISLKALGKYWSPWCKYNQYLIALSHCKGLQINNRFPH